MRDGKVQVCIVHDSQLGNGRLLAEAMQERMQELGAHVTVDHVTGLNPASAMTARPDLIVVGSAVRAFTTSPATRRWMRELGRELAGPGASTPRLALFVTHALPREMVDRKAQRLLGRLAKMVGPDLLYPGWISGRVIAKEGPFADGVVDQAADEAERILAWAAPAGEHARG